MRYGFMIHFCINESSLQARQLISAVMTIRITVIDIGD